MGTNVIFSTISRWCVVYYWYTAGADGARFTLTISNLVRFGQMQFDVVFSHTGHRYDTGVQRKY